MKKAGVILAAASLLASALFVFNPFQAPQPNGNHSLRIQAPAPKAVPATRSAKKVSKAKRNKGRAEHFFRLLHDPKTNRIPENIRERELDFAANLPVRERVAKTRPDLLTEARTWKEAGPNDVGGRTRALGVDPRNSSIVLAGGVNGGVWRSTDRGVTWSAKTGISENLSVMALAQDPTSRNTWYYAMGEYLGSDSDRGFTAFFFGSGLFKSVDNGQTWTFKQFATNKFPVSWDSDFHYTTDIKVSPLNGNVFLGSVGGGLLRSANGGDSFTGVLGNGLNDHEFVEFDIAPSGRLAAALSMGDSEAPLTTPGIYVSDSNGDSWTNITPATFPDTASRSLVKFAPSNPNVLYALVNAGSVTEDRDSVLFYKFVRNSTTGAWTSENRTANLPRFGGAAGDMLTQGSYNMLLAVKPDDENFVIIGFTNLFRSKNGFSTPANSKIDHWIGGYTNTADNFELYPNHHPDQHALVFDPENPNRAWSGHDGGLSYTTNIGASPVVWESKNNGYNVTQFYTVAIASNAGSNALLGGTQDNGSPYFDFDGSSTSPSVDISSGDGSYAHIGNRYIYTSSQSGWIDQYDTQSERWSYGVHPQNASQNMLFIHPFAVNPANDAEMVYPDLRSIWLNTTLGNANKQTGWTKHTPSTTVLPTGFIISTLAWAGTPSNTVYAVAYRRNSAPRLIVFNTSSKTFTNLSITGAADGSYPHGIAVNPADGNEFIIVFSNYNIPSVFHTTNGGVNFTNLEGNLAGTTQQPGPSVRSAAIVRNSDGSKEYFVGTSVGLYGTRSLNGNNTVWVREGDAKIGTAIVEALAARSSDGRVAAATHGRGIFVGNLGSNVSNELAQPRLEFALLAPFPNPFNPSTTISFVMPSPGRVRLIVFDVSGRQVATLFNGMAPQGKTDAIFDAGRLSSGVYIFKLESTYGNASRKVTLIK